MAKGFKTGGRAKGTPNAENKELRLMILEALSLQKGGGVAYLARQAEENPGPFLSLLGKILPTQVTGKDGEPIAVNVYLPHNARFDN